MNAPTETAPPRSHPSDPDDGPSANDLIAIEAEWPLLSAELAVVNAECQLLNYPSDFSVRALRRAHRALAVALAHAHNHPCISIHPSMNQTQGAS